MVVRCHGCDRVAHFLAGDLAHCYGYDVAVRSLRFACKQCGTRGHPCHLKVPPDPGTRVIVWKPVE